MALGDQAIIQQPGVFDSAGLFTPGESVPEDVFNGEVKIKGLGVAGGAGLEARRIVNLKPRDATLGDLNTVTLTIVKKVGTAPTSIDFAIYLIDDVISPIAQLIHRQLYENTGLSPAGTVPVVIIPPDLISRRIFASKVKGKLQVVITHTGGAADTDYDYLLDFTAEKMGV